MERKMEEAKAAINSYISLCSTVSRAQTSNHLPGVIARSEKVGSAPLGVTKEEAWWLARTTSVEQ
jgi:hypothetical protein